MSAKVEAFLNANGINPAGKNLAQYGVPGMKWGQRKRRGSSSTPTVAKDTAKKAPAAPAKAPNTLSNKPKNRRMSDAELRSKVNRLQMEKQLADLSQGQKKGESFVKGLLKDTGKQVARDVTKKLATAAVQIALEKAAGKAVAGSTNQLLLTAMASGGGKKKKG